MTRSKDGTDDGLRSGALSTEVYAQLRSMIETGEVGPGERLIELQVAASFQVSRSPVRRALDLLVEEGLVTRHDNRGYVVSGLAVHQGAGGAAKLGDVSVNVLRQWERIYGEVEQVMLSEVLHRSIKVNELRLAAHFGVSRTVTRDVLARMHGVGIITKDRSGHWLAAKVTPERVRHLYELRRILEPHALAQAAPLISSDQLAQARHRIEQLLEAQRVDSTGFDHVESDLHVDMLAACPNQEITKALEQTYVLFAPTRHLFNPVLGIPTTLIKDALIEHLDIIGSLETGDTAKATSQLSSHLESAVNRWLLRFEAGAQPMTNPLPDYLTVMEE
jgi:DNA-binding GntR family transcriptional regulator